ncbi:MAG: pyridoxal phosphate-dependent aminotransferase [Tannerellaceae bacterium]|jgi:aspartate aminotransferase|nr:pyridoxal phosphate-dependent aminotransferase [Tannerellaceae bacterium]
MTQVSDRIAGLSPSETLAMSQKSNELKAQGIDVINLSVGEPDFFTPGHIKAAARKAIERNYSFYTPVAGYPELRKAIADKLKRENRLDYATEQIVVSNGAKQSVCNALLSILNPGDEVILPAPYWVSYVEMVRLAQGVNVIVPTGIEEEFKLTPTRLEAAITPRTKALILCSPSNPTGSVYTREELEGLAGVLERHGRILILSDEIYEHIHYGEEHQSIAQFANIRNRVILINGVSKAYAMTGWRIGFMAAPLEIAQACCKLQGQYTSGAGSIAQQAAIAAFSGDQACVREMCEAFRRRRDLTVALCREIPNLRFTVPQGAFYLFPEVDRYFGKQIGERIIRDVADLALYLLEVAHVATVGGAAFGAPGCLRLSYAASEENLTEAITRIKNALFVLNG